MPGGESTDGELLAVQFEESPFHLPLALSPGLPRWRGQDTGNRGPPYGTDCKLLHCLQYSYMVARD